MIPAAGFAYLWKWAEDKQTKPVVEQEVIAPIPAAMATPVLSFRRAPQTLQTVASEAALVTQLNNVAQFVPDGSCLVVSLNGRVMVSDGGDAKVIPASNEKLLTAAVALNQLGPDYTFTTRVLGTVVDGVVQGDLYLVGGGDPTLSTADYIATFSKYAPINTTSMETLVANVLGRRRHGRHRAGGGRRDAIRRGAVCPRVGRQHQRYGSGTADRADRQRRDRGDRHRLDRPLGRPRSRPARVLSQLLRNAGVNMGNNTSNGAAPPEATEIASITSAPLSAIITDMLTNSDDNTAELLVKELGYHFDGVGTTVNGVSVVSRVLVTLGIDTTQIITADGSGLGSGNIVTCNILLQLIDADLRTPPRVLTTGLPVAGVSGTLFDKFLGTSVAGRLQAKTGSLTNVRALTGFLPTSLGNLEFSLVLNFPDAQADEVYSPIWNALAMAIAPYPAGPSVDVLQPR